MKDHNFERKVRPYNKTPASVTVDDVEKMNEINRDHNESIKEFKIGDKVKIQLKKDKLQKGRHQKYSDGYYEIIGRDFRHYLVKPLNFDLKAYSNYFTLPEAELKGTPVYFRKSYEMKLINDVNNYYFPAEN